MDDDASSLLVTRLMQTGSNITSHVSECIAASTAAAIGGVKTAFTDNSSVDPLQEQGTASSLHQLSLYVCMPVTFMCQIFV